MRDSQANNLFEHKKPNKNEYHSRRALVVQSDTKRPKVENMERRPVIIKHRTQRRRTSRIAIRPARDVWKHELYEAKGRQIIRKCEILKQMTRERENVSITQVNWRKVIQKVETSRTGAPRRDAPSHERLALVFLMFSIPLRRRWIFLNREWK